MKHFVTKQVASVRSWWNQRNRSLLPLIFAEAAPLDFRIVGRMLFHAALVGIGAGLIGAAFFASLQYVEHYLIEVLAGYRPLRANGEYIVPLAKEPVFRPWLLLLLPALGGLACGLIVRFAPEAGGGGGDAMIDAFHQKRGNIRGRVIWLKPLASLFTLGTGGSGGREGPTMLIGAALGSTVGRLLKVSTRERRILLVAGVAAGIAAVFRTPLGAALLAVEVLYRDGFESDALVPSVFASVIAYSIIISIFGESTLFSHAGRFPFDPMQLPLYALMTLIIALFAHSFTVLLKRTHRFMQSLPVAPWLRPAIGGLILGILCVPLVIFVGDKIGSEGQGLGLLGGGYGAVQMAISGSAWLPSGWRAVELLVLLTLAKFVASSITIGSGGSAGDFAPSLALGGLLGGAFGRAVQILMNDPSIDPGAFALVGMGVFYGGIACVPLSALVLVCELAGNYDLLVPLMLCLGIAYVVLRKSNLYEAQVPTLSDSPAHRNVSLFDTLRNIPVGEVMTSSQPFVSFSLTTTAAEVLRHLGESTWQDVFPVVDAEGRLQGLVTNDAPRILALAQEDASWALAADIMQPPVIIHPDNDLRTATECLLANRLREVPVVDMDHRVIGFLDEHEIARVYLRPDSRADTHPGC